MRPACLVTSLPLPIATPMSACLSAAASLTASPVIATISPCSCISRARRSLSSGRDAPEHVQLRAAGATSSSSDSAWSSVPLIAPGPSPSASPIAWAVTAWSPVIMRTSMPALSAVSTAPFASGAQRVDDADHADEREVVGERHRVVGHRRRARRRRRTGRRRRARAGPSPPSARWRRRSRRAPRRSATCEPLNGPPAMVQRASTTSGAALDELDDALAAVDGDAVERRHELVVGVERHLGQARVGAARLLGVDAELGRQHDERGLGRVADDAAVVGDGRVAVEHEPEGEPGEVGHRGAGDRPDRAGLAVALALDGEPRAGGVERRDHHLVHRQRAGLVGVDRARRAERLDVGEVLDDRLGLGELLGAAATAGPRRTPAGRSGSPRSPSRCRAAARRSKSSPRARPTTTMNATAAQAIVPSTLVSESSSRCSGERVRVTEVSIVAIWPISVCMPVAVTTIAAVPRVTEVFWNSMFERSPSATSPPASASASFGIGALSPVSAASCVSSVGGAQDPPVGRHEVAGLDLDDVAGHDVDRRHERDASRRARPSPAAPAASTARRRWPAPSAPGARRARR